MSNWQQGSSGQGSSGRNYNGSASRSHRSYDECNDEEDPLEGSSRHLSASQPYVPGYSVTYYDRDGRPVPTPVGHSFPRVPASLSRQQSDRDRISALYHREVGLSCQQSWPDDHSAEDDGSNWRLTQPLDPADQWSVQRVIDSAESPGLLYGGRSLTGRQREISDTQVYFPQSSERTFDPSQEDLRQHEQRTTTALTNEMRDASQDKERKTEAAKKADQKYEEAVSKLDIVRSQEKVFGPSAAGPCIEGLHPIDYWKIEVEKRKAQRNTANAESNRADDKYARARARFEAHCNQNRRR